MRKVLTAKDLAYIEFVKGQLDLIELDVIESASGFSWDNKYTNTKENESIRARMIQCLTNDLINDTKTHRYEMNLGYYPKPEHYYDLIKPLKNNELSHWLVARMIELIDEKNIFIELLGTIFDNKNFDLGLALAYIPFEYDNTLERRSTYAQFIFFCRQAVFSFPDKIDEINQIFIIHMENTKKNIYSHQLISDYYSIFGNHLLNEFLNHFQLNQKSSLFQIQSQHYSKVNLSLTALATTNLYQDIINQIVFVLNQDTKNFDFPKIYIIERNEEFLVLHIELKTPYSELQVQTLLDMLIEKQYSISLDKTHNYQVLLELAQQVSEKFYLENNLKNSNYSHLNKNIKI
jgi:hypothetical protein